jgi:phage terminase Nu1 subunit (DNA packaging protein)
LFCQVFNQVGEVGVFGMSRSKKELGLVNKSTLVSSLGISSQAFDKWGVDAREKRGRENFYAVADVVQNRVENQLSNMSKPGIKKPSKNDQIEQPDEDLLRVEKLSEEVRALKLKNDILEARSIPVEVATEVLVGIISEQVAILETIPLLVKRHNPEMPSHAIDQIQRDISKVSNIAATLGDKLDDTITNLVSAAESKVK